MDAQTRILWLPKKLNRGEIIDTTQDELWINEKDETPRLNYKTIRRDFDAIKSVFWRDRDKAHRVWLLSSDQYKFT